MKTYKALVAGLAVVLALLLAGLSVALAAPLTGEDAAQAASLVGDDGDETEFSGTISAIDEEAGTFEVTVATTGGSAVMVYTVRPPEDFDWSSIAVGDVVEVEGTLGDDGVVTAEEIDVESEEDEDDGDDDDEDDQDGEVNFYCDNPDLHHPVAGSIAATYDVSYTQVLDWFCAGYGFGEIRLALLTAEFTGEPAEGYLDQRTGGEGWGEIWHGLGHNGKPKDNGPPDHAAAADKTGRPDYAGPPDETDGSNASGTTVKTGSSGQSGTSPANGPPDQAGAPDKKESPAKGGSHDKGNPPGNSGSSGNKGRKPKGGGKP